MRYEDLNKSRRLCSSVDGRCEDCPVNAHDKPTTIMCYRVAMALAGEELAEIARRLWPDE